ncbi:kinetochore-associated protein 1 isoform X2 [Cylas formicarius]|uniref:kinetochore-associated protein 1 isoform X2 n=1 Tax=Cylas formicarius TaxID=197179 RepID=UPI0029589ADD|nr:kinetochore-associated protein 1 isoform X2 [Cylas formicarius]
MYSLRVTYVGFGEIKTNLLKYEEEFWTNLIEVLLMFIESVDKKLEAIKGVLEIANLPWSNTVKNLARLTFGFSTDNQLAEDIKDLLVNERRLIILHKYSLQGKPVIEDIKFCFKRILYLDRESAIEDIYQLCKDDEQRYIADEIILQKLIETERYLEALNVLNRGIQPNKLIDSLFRLTYTFVSHLVSHKLVDRYFKMMDLIWKRNKFDKDRAVDRYTRFIFENTRSIYKLRAEFGISATSAQLCSKTEKRKLFDVVVKQMALSITDDYTDIEPILRFSKKVASSMSVSSDDVIVKFLSICDNFQLILNIGEHLLEISTSSQHLAVFSIFVFKYTKILAENDLDETIFDFSETCSQKDEDYILGIRLAKKLAVKALIYATTDDFHAVMEVVNWADTCCFFEVSQGVSYTHSASLSVVKRVFENYVAYIETFKHPNTRYLTHFSNGRSINQDQLRSNIKELSSDINVLIRDNEHFTAYSLIKTLHQGLSDNSQTNREVSVAINDLIRRTWLPQTLEATLSSKCLDKSLFFNLMLLFDNEFETHLETYLKAYKRQPSKLACIAQVGLDLLKLHKITTGQVDLRNIINTCKWWSKCKSYKLDYDKFFKCNTGSRFVMLVSAKLIDLDNVTEYCNDFRQDPQVCYLKYLRTLLLDWKPDVELKSDIEGKKIAIVKNDEKELFNTCWSIVDRIHNKFEVVDLVQKVWNSVNFYYYEVYLTLIYLQTNLETQSTVSTVSINKSLLMFLKKYTRTSPPTRSEIEQWYGAFPKAAFIDSLSEFRLPLTATFLSDGIWNIIKPEVNLKTYKEWFELTDVLGEFLNCQDICTYAINSLLSTALFNTSQSCEWDLYAKHENLVSEVDDCAANIEDLQRATAAVYTFMCGMPQGADKVNFAKLGYKYAKMYKERHAGEDVEQVYQKVKQRYYNYSAMHVLYKYQLPEKKYQELVAQPKKLISALYEDPRILLKAVNVMVYCPDINSAVSDLTELFGLNLEKVKYDLLEGLLQSASVLDDNYVQKYQSGNFKEFDNLKRACYMCSDAILPFWQQTLLNIGIPTNSAPEIQCDMIFKGNALKCFYYISDADAVETMTNMSQADFFRLMEKVSVIGDINTLGINVSSVVQLDDCIKKTFVVLNKHNDPLAIKCMGSLCKIYNIQDMKYWNFILNAAMNFHMAKELVDYLNYLKGGLITPVIENAWRFIVNNAFSLLSIALQDTDTSNDRITNKFIKAVHLVQACPILPSLDFDTYIQNFIARGRFDFAAALLQYAPDKKDCYLKQLLSSGTLLQDLKALKTLGVMGVEKIILTLLSC